MMKHDALPPSVRVHTKRRRRAFFRVSLFNRHIRLEKKKKLPFNKSAYFSLVWRDIPTIFIVPETTHSSQRPRTCRRLNIINITHTTTTLQLTPTTYKPLNFSF